MSLQLDVSERHRIDKIVDQVASQFGGLQILVNNAGITRHGPSESMSDEDWDAVVDVNMTAPFACSRAAARYMLRQGEGRIISITSIMGAERKSDFPTYPIPGNEGGAGKHDTRARGRVGTSRD